MFAYDLITYYHYHYHLLSLSLISKSFTSFNLDFSDSLVKEVEEVVMML